ncbi:class I SAM-dependent methyltransferase [Planctomicrobium sp. SH661]|uniref:class I SAM-dependent methyltransferase n=1 Tax=Planctomicrobium sp. SH661 TaxID=3448124 RepID=UPI003F5C7B66
MTTKDFGPIESDYAFFMSHATEAESDVAEYVRQLRGFTSGREAIHMLDFGCGTGNFTQQFLNAMNWPVDSLHLTLVEPVRHQQEQAARNLSPYSRFPIEIPAGLSSVQPSLFDVVLVNHVLYYVDDLESTVPQLARLLKPEGKLLITIAGWDNSLNQFWKIGFELLGRPIPYYVSEDVEAILNRLGLPFRKSKAAYRLTFPDTIDNRMKILRFLFGEHLHEISPQLLLGGFDRYVQGEEILIETDSDHYLIER